MRQPEEVNRKRLCAPYRSGIARTVGVGRRFRRAAGLPDPGRLLR